MLASQLPAIPPHRFYYLHNFQQALDWLARRYGDLLDTSERAFLQQFAQLPQPSQALRVRMVMRKGPWFRARKLVYEEIGDRALAAQPLLALGWLSCDEPMALAELFALHTKPELLQMLKVDDGYPRSEGLKCRRHCLDGGHGRETPAHISFCNQTKSFASWLDTCHKGEKSHEFQRQTRQCGAR